MYIAPPLRYVSKKRDKEERDFRARTLFREDINLLWRD